MVFVGVFCWRLLVKYGLLFVSFLGLRVLLGFEGGFQKPWWPLLYETIVCLSQTPPGHSSKPMELRPWKWW